MKWYDAHEMTLRAVLEIMFMCYCAHILRRQSLRASRVLQYVCSKQNRASVPFIHTYFHIYDSYRIHI